MSDNKELKNQIDKIWETGEEGLHYILDNINEDNSLKDIREIVNEVTDKFLTVCYDLRSLRKALRKRPRSEEASVPEQASKK